MFSPANLSPFTIYVGNNSVLAAFQYGHEVLESTCEGLGVDLLYKRSGKVVGERTMAPKSSLLIELCFIDDVVITASTREDIT